jgi:hypothetical protein
MDTYSNMKKIIAIGKKTKEDLATILDIFLTNNRITNDEYNELLVLIEGVK